jgi:hypothetical protein
VTPTYYPERVRSEWLDSRLELIILTFNGGGGWLCPHYLEWSDQELLISFRRPNEATCVECAEAIHRPAPTDYPCDKCGAVLPSLAEVAHGWIELPRAAVAGSPTWLVLVALCHDCADVEGFKY